MATYQSINSKLESIKNDIKKLQSELDKFSIAKYSQGSYVMSRLYGPCMVWDLDIDIQGKVIYTIVGKFATSKKTFEDDLVPYNETSKILYE